MVNYPLLSSFPTLTTLFPYLRFKACLDCLTASHLCTEEQGVGCDDVIKDYDVIIVMSELVIPRMIPFPTIIYKFILIPFILTWSLRGICMYTCMHACMYGYINACTCYQYWILVWIRIKCRTRSRCAVCIPVRHQLCNLCILFSETIHIFDCYPWFSLWHPICSRSKEFIQ